MGDNPYDDPDDDLDPEEKAEKLKREQEFDKQIDDKVAKKCADAGFSHIKTLGGLLEHYQNMNDQDKLAFPILKELADGFNMTPHQFVKSIQARAQAMKGKSTETQPVDQKGEKAADALKNFADRTELQTKLQNGFLRFQMKMEKEDTDIPDNMYDDLVALIPAVLMGKNKEQIVKTDWFGAAYRLYLFNLSEEEDLEKVRDKLSAHDKKRLERLKQLGIPQGGGKPPKAPTEEVKTWGGGIENLPEPKK